MAVSNARTSAATNAGERGLVITCIFDAGPRLPLPARSGYVARAGHTGSW